jgi:phosphoribosylamine--glycine ligase
MNVLVMGSGGREYSIGLALKKDESVENLYFAPGNGATLGLGNNVSYANYDELIAYVKENDIDLTIVGPEAPLVDGVVDMFKAEGLTIFGPSKAAAQLEGSKVYMKNFLAKYNQPPMLRQTL